MKKLVLFWIIFQILDPIQAQSQTLQWAKQIGGTLNDEGYSIIVDPSGNVYTTGRFRGTTDFDPGNGVHNLTSAGSDDVFISKLDATGNFVWAKSIGGINDDYAYSIAIDGSGNVYTTGAFEGTVDFDPGSGTFNLTGSGMSDIFISKINSSGNFVWAKAIGGTLPDYANAIAVDASGNVYLTGTYNGTVDFDPGAGTFNLNSAGSQDVFILKMNVSGIFTWAKSLGGTNSESGQAIASDQSGNIYTTGYFIGTADFDPGAGTFNLTSTGNSAGDIFVSKLNSSGNFVWVKSMGGNFSDIANSIALDASGNIYTTGYFQGLSDFDPGPGTYTLTSFGSIITFISKLDVSGNFVWAKSIGDYSNNSSRSIDIDAFGDLYITGDFQYGSDFDPGTGTSFLTSAGGSDVFILSLDASGNFRWANSVGGSSSEGGNAIAVDNNLNIFITGSFFGTCDFDPGTGVLNLTSVGSSDIFVYKMTHGPVGLEENSISNSISIYPNPANTLLNISSNNSTKLESIKIKTLYGQVLFEISELNSDNSIVDISTFPNGIYILETTEGGRIFRSKIIKE